jgi:hypothetical protein
MGVIFMNPLFLAAVSAAAIPLIIHLIHQRRSRVVDFSSLKFLKLVDLKVARSKRLKEILLMALRMSILALLALALARPVLTPKSASAAGNAAASAVFILDDSYSMSASSGGSAVFARALEALDKSLSTFSDGDQIAFMLLSAPDNSAAFSSKVSDISGKLKSARPSSIRGNAAAALEAAYALLRKSTAPNKEIFIATDLQNSLWKSAAASKLPRFDKSVAIYILDAGASEPLSNLAVTNVSVGAGAKPGSACVDALVRNFGTDAVSVAVSLSWDGARVRESSSAVPPGGESLVRFEVEKVTPGIHEGFVSLSGDAVAADNVRFFTTDRPAKKRILLIDGAPSAVPYQDEVFYLKYALDPGLAGTDSVFESETAAFRTLDPSVLSKFSAVVLANVPAVPPPVAARIEEFVRSGGALVVFPGDMVNFKQYENTIGHLLPARIAAPFGSVEDRGEGGAFKLRLEPGHEAFAQIAADVSAPLEEARFWRAFGLERIKGRGRVMAAFSNSEDAIVEWQIGKGRVVLAAFPADMDWSNLPVRSAFVPLVHQIFKFAAGIRDIKSDFLAGEVLNVQIEPGNASVVLPSGETLQLGKAGSDGTVACPGTRETGVYKFKAGGVTRAAAVNVDTAESVLERADEKTLSAVFRPARFAVIKDPADVPSAVNEFRHGVELFTYLLILAIAAFLLECWLSNTFAAKKSGEIRPLDDLGRLRESAGKTGAPQSAPLEMEEAAK